MSYDESTSYYGICHQTQKELILTYHIIEYVNIFIPLANISERKTISIPARRKRSWCIVSERKDFNHYKIICYFSMFRKYTYASEKLSFVGVGRFECALYPDARQ